MTTYAWPLQQAVYAALNDASLSGVKHIVDYQIEGPTDDDFPYVSIGDEQSIQDDVSCADGSEEYFDLHIWARSNSEHTGNKICKQLMGKIHTAMHDQSFTVSGLESAHCFVTGSRTLDDPDGKTKHGITSITIYCREA